MVIADPVGSVLADYIHTGTLGTAGSWAVEGIGEDFIPDNAQMDLVAKAYEITDRESVETARELLEKELGEPGPDRIWYVGDAFAAGWSVDEVNAITRIDPWFLEQIHEIIAMEMQIDALVAKAEATPAKASITTAIISTGRRPMRSASLPKTKAPISMPMKKKVPVCSASGTVLPKVLAMDGALKPMDSTCMASASQTRPKITNSRY